MINSKRKHVYCKTRAKAQSFEIMTIGIVTCSEVSGLTASEQVLIPLFQGEGVVAKAVVWNDDTVDWKAYDYLIIRSVWDYHLHHDAFTDWITTLENKGIKTLNPVQVIRSNQHKFYLRRLQEKGIAIVPTQFVDRTMNLDLSFIRESGWEQMVIKPAISASSFLTENFSIAQLEDIENTYAPIAQKRDLLVQQFMPEVRHFGELSIIFFNRTYSHTVLKTATSGEFRVQSEYGGSTTVYRPSRAIMETAKEILSQFDGTLLYARIDGLIRNGRFVLMEIELIEPDLFLEYDGEAARRFVKATLAIARP
ncbi:MAG: hypothetical protein Mars2KO_34520 [Maribacter sp.]